MMTMGSSPYFLLFLLLKSGSLSRKAATYGVKMAVYMTSSRMTQSQTALKGL
jgi:hypothetical protein